MFTKKIPSPGKGIAPGLKVVSDVMKKTGHTYKNANLLPGKNKKKLNLK